MTVVIEDAVMEVNEVAIAAHQALRVSDVVVK